MSLHRRRLNLAEADDLRERWAAEDSARRTEWTAAMARRDKRKRFTRLGVYGTIAAIFWAGVAALMVMR